MLQSKMLVAIVALLSLYIMALGFRESKRILRHNENQNYTQSLTDVVWPKVIIPPSPMRITRGCVSFIAYPGMSCQWFSHFCEQKFQSQNYYFLDDICSAVGPRPTDIRLPIPGKNYTCCTADAKEL